MRSTHVSRHPAFHKLPICACRYVLAGKSIVRSSSEGLHAVHDVEALTWKVCEMHYTWSVNDKALDDQRTMLQRIIRCVHPCADHLSCHGLWLSQRSMINCAFWPALRYKDLPRPLTIFIFHSQPIPSISPSTHQHSNQRTCSVLSLPQSWSPFPCHLSGCLLHLVSYSHSYKIDTDRIRFCGSSNSGWRYPWSPTKAWQTS